MASSWLPFSGGERTKEHVVQCQELVGSVDSGYKTLEEEWLSVSG